MQTLPVLSFCDGEGSAAAWLWQVTVPGPAAAVAAAKLANTPPSAIA